MKILITGAKGFIGRNLIATLRQNQEHIVYEYDRDSDFLLLDSYCKETEFVFHLAGVNRPLDESEYIKGNHDFTMTLLETLKKYHNTCPIMLASSIQAELDNPYGRSKKESEELLIKYHRDTNVEVLIYRFLNVFGKWCKPNYNSVVATFCHNIAHSLPIQIHDPNVMLKLIYIDDVVNELIRALDGKANIVDEFCEVAISHTISLNQLAKLIYSFKESRDNKSIVNMQDAFTKKLYSTYLSYLPTDQFKYELKTHLDDRGSFTEFIKTPDRGQVSVNISKPGIVKGNHWHHSKNEKFLVVSGKAIIRFRQIDASSIIEYYVSGDKLEVVDIPCGYTHNIENIGSSDLVTIMWANELFDPENIDTYYLEV